MFRRICGLFTTLIIIGLAVTGALLVIPNLMGYMSMAVLSGSMAPEIPVGSIVYAKEVVFEDLEVGDIISYRIGGDTMVTHRVQEVDAAEKTVITKGDANEVADASVVVNADILGKVDFHVPYLGYVAIYARTPIGIAAICTVLIVLILLNFLPDIISKEKEEAVEDINKQKNG